MKVLHVITDTNIGGAGRYLLNLLSEPAFKGVEVLVACPEGELAKRLDAMGLHRIPISGRDVSYSSRLTRELGEIIDEHRPDLVHTHSSLSGRIAARLRGTPIVYTKHNLVRIPDEKGVLPPRAGFGKRWLNRLLANVLADRIIAVSEGVRKDLAESGVKPAMIATIPNGIDLTPYVRRQAGGKRGFRVGTVARLHRQKALDVMLEAAKLVLSSEPAARFVIGGTGPMEAELKAKIKELRLEPYVKMAGFVSDVPDFLSKLDVYVLSSDYEGLPLAVLEAMGAGLPVASTAVGGVPEAVVDGQSGFLVPPRQPKALAQAIVRLLVDPDLARQMGIAGRSRAEELFDAKVMAEKTVKVYRRAVARRRRISPEHHEHAG
jgi:glycosyltransferase involved in cell wall biosynthesis